LKHKILFFLLNDTTLRIILDWQSDPDKAAESLTPTLIRWYEHHKRDLPWRHTRDPYRIWLSEVILQQTRVAQGLPYYQRFVEAYPTVEALAAADEAALLRLWQGLGYYSRARNLHRTARQISTERRGRFPQTYTDLLRLSGIGSYTAAAVASFAFGEKVAVVDGNVYRVLARVFGIAEDITTTGARKTFATLANRLIQATDDPATYNQAIMEFGAIQCTPVAPDCLLCPLQQACVAYQTGRQQRLPVKSRKAPVRERYFNYLVFQQPGAGGQVRLALRERRAKDVWQHLYDFFLVETDEPVDAYRYLPEHAASKLVLEDGYFGGPADERTQLLSHQRIRAKFWRVNFPAEATVALPEGLHFYELADIERLPKPQLIDQYLKSADF